jgi:zinc protease
LPQLLRPGFREEDFARLHEQQANALVLDLRSNNEEELGKERLQELIFRGSDYGHTCLGTVAGVEALTLDDVREWVTTRFTRANLIAGLAGDWPQDARSKLVEALNALPAGEPAPGPTAAARPQDGISIEIIEKDTRSIAISFGHPIEVTRTHSDFAALWLARAWLGEHRASQGRLFQRLREVRGLNYGNYAYVEAFPRGMYQFFPDPNLGRRAQIFEVWIRPVAPEHGIFALKAALYEVRKLIEHGLNADQFEETQTYLMKNIFVTTKTQDQQLGYALDSRWYSMGDYVETLRSAIGALTVDEVNAAVKRHLSGENLQVVMIAKDVATLRDELLAGALTAIEYGSPKPDDVLSEDQEIGAIDLRLAPERVTITPVDQVFAR